MIVEIIELIHVIVYILYIFYKRYFKRENAIGKASYEGNTKLLCHLRKIGSRISIINKLFTLRLIVDLLYTYVQP